MKDNSKKEYFINNNKQDKRIKRETFIDTETIIKIVLNKIITKSIFKAQKKEIDEKMKNDQKNIVIIKNLLQSAELKAEKDEEKRKLFKLQNELDDALKKIEQEVHNQDGQIDNIDKKVDDSLYRIEKANNQELEKAARIAINRRRLSYQIGLGATFGAIGSVVPGIGNAVGAALGALIGYGIYRVDMHRLNKATKNKEKLGNEIDNK